MRYHQRQFFRFLLFLSFTLFPCVVFSATYSSVQSGDWNDPGTWGSGTYPGNGDQVYIGSGTIVTYNGDLSLTSGQIQLQGGKLNINGNLTLGSSFNIGSTSQGGTLFVLGNLVLSCNFPVDGGAEIIVTKNLTSNSNFYLNDGLLVVNGDFIKYGTLTIDNGSQIVVVGDFNSSSGSTWINSGNFYTFGSIICTGSNCSSIESQTDWNNLSNPPGQQYVNSGTIELYSSGSFTVPEGVTSITVECWGGGGGGATITSKNTGGGGGGGGAYASSTINVTPGGQYNFTVGNGGTNGSNGGTTSFNSTSVVAVGGQGAGTNSAGGALGGSASSSIGDIVYSGGSGGSGSNGKNANSGGGGGGAGSSGAGGNASGMVAGTGTSENGGNGGNGVSASSNGLGGNLFGGGGSGAAQGNSNNSYTGGVGADGGIIISFTSSSSLSLSISSTQNVTCNGGSDGQATVSVSDGTSPYSYVWENSSNVVVRTNSSSGNADDTATGLQADDYTVTVTDNDGKSSSIMVSISEPAVLNATISQTSPTCGNSDGSISISGSSGGSGNYEYSIDGGSHWQSSSTFSNLSVGTYNIQIRDASVPSCSVVLDVNYNLNSSEVSIPLTAQSNTVECPNSTNGVIDLSVPYPIQFSDPNYIDLGNTLMSNLSEFTLEGWIKVDLSAIGFRISLFGQNDAIEFGFSDSNTLGCWTALGGSVSTNAYPSDNAWHHVAAVGDGSSITLYIDGVEVATSAYVTGNYGSDTNYTSKIGAGVWDPSGGNFPGQMIKVGFWNTALTSGEISNMASGLYQYVGTESGLMAGYNFYEGAGTSLGSMPSGNDGIFSGSPVWQDNYSYLWTKTGDAGFSESTQDLSGLSPGTYNVTVTNSSIGCSNTGSWNVDVQDTQAPTPVCKNISVALNGSGSVTITPTQVNNGSSDNCTSAGNLTLSLDRSSFTCSELGDNTVILTVTDESGNSSICNSTVTVEDQTDPTAVCKDITVHLNASGQATVTAGGIDNGSTDNCTSQANLVLKIDGLDQVTYGCSNTGLQTATLTVEDESGNIGSCTANINVVNDAPVFSSCPNDITVNLTSSDVGGYWEYRRPITITNSGSNLTDYQVKINVSMESGKMNPDFSDIRFRASDGTTSLPFWLEQQDGSTAVFWVKVPSIGSSQTIYMLYGNSLASSTSNANNTFIYFDNMDSSSGWTDVAAGGSVTTNSSVFGFNVLVKQDADDPSGGQKSIGTTISDFKLITREQRASTGPGGATNGGSMDRYGLEDGSGNGYSFTRNADVSSSGTFGFERRTNGSASGGSTSSAIQPRDNWYVTELEKNGSAFVASIYEDNHSNLLGSVSGNDSNHNTFTHLAVRGGHYYYIDWMAVAKSAPTEPVVSIGSEETLNSATCEKAVNIPVPSVSDDSGSYSLTNDFNGSSDASGTYPVGTTQVTFTATDGCGLTSTCSLNVTVNDQIDPIISCPGDITATTADNPLTIPQPSFTDNCTGATIQNSFNGSADASGTYPVGTTPVVWTVTDAAGNTATCTMNVTIEYSCKINDVSFTPVSCAGANDATIQITATGDGQLSYSIDGGTSFQTSSLFTGVAPGTYNIVISDAAGCTKSWTDPIEITSGNDFSTSATITPATCSGNSDGVIDVTLNSYLSKSIYFDGADDYIALSQSFSGTSAISALTVCAWVKCNPGEGGWSILDFDRSEYFNVSLGGTNRSGNTIEFATNSDLGGGVDDMAGNIDVKDGQWHFIAAVYDGTDKYLYVDGTLDNQKNNPHNGQPLGSNLTRFGFIGDGSEASTENGSRNSVFYKGWIAEVDYWDRALSADEIRQRMHSSLSGTESNLVAAWNMEEGSGTTVAPGGTIYNGATWTDDVPYSYSWTKQGDGTFSASTQDLSGLSIGTYDLTVLFDGACQYTTSYDVLSGDTAVPVITVPEFSVGNDTVTCIPEFEYYADFQNASTLFPGVFNSDGTVTTPCNNEDTATFQYQDVYENGSCPKTVTRTYTIQNDLGVEGSAQQVFILKDTEAPVINNGNSINLVSADADQNCLASLTISEPPVSDNCGYGTVGVEVTANPTVGNFNYDSSAKEVSGNFPLGETILTWAVTDECGNSATKEQQVIVSDNTPPSITCPTDQTEDAGGSCQFILPDYTNVTVSDNCTSNNNIVVKQVPAPGTVYLADGTINITLTATDDALLSNSCSFNVNVSGIVPVDLTSISYDNDKTEADNGYGMNPMQTSTHIYYVDSNTPETGYTYSWEIQTTLGVAISSNLYTITNLGSKQDSVAITFNSSTDTIPPGNYIISVIKTKNTTSCNKQEILPVTIQQNNFDVALLPAGDNCQAGETGTPTTITWEIQFPSVATEPFKLNYQITLDGSAVCSGTVSNIQYSSASVTHITGCPVGSPVTPPYAQASKNADSYTVQLQYTINSITGVDQQIGIMIDATDVYQVSDPNISNNSETLNEFGIPNTSEITTD